MDEGRPLGDPFLHVEDRRERLVVDRDEGGGLGGSLGRLGGDGGDRVADEADAVGREDRLVLQVDAGVEREVAPRDDGADAGHPRRPLRPHVEDPRVRVGGPDDGDVEEARELQVGGVLRRPRHLLEAVDARDVLADGTGGGHAGTSSRAALSPASAPGAARISAAASRTASTICR